MKPLDQAEHWMSYYCRLRDALEWNKKFPEDITGVDPRKLVVKCCTCSKIGSWLYSIQAGHFISKGSRGESGVRFDERNVHAQCKDCNAFNQGRQLDYGDYMREKYGQEVIDELRRDDIALTHQRGEIELLSFARLYKDLYDKLIDENFV